MYVEQLQPGGGGACEEGRRAVVAERAEREVEDAQPFEDGRVCHRDGNRVAQLAVAQAEVRKVGEELAGEERREVNDLRVRAVVLVAQPEFEVFERRQFRRRNVADDARVQPAALDDERLQVLVPERPEAQPVAAAHAEVFELRVSGEERRHVRLLNPGNLVLLADDVAEEERAQAGQFIRGGGYRLDRLARASERRRQVAPHADDERRDLARPRLVQQRVELLLPARAALGLVVGEGDAVSVIRRVNERRPRLPLYHRLPGELGRVFVNRHRCLSPASYFYR